MSLKCKICERWTPSDSAPIDSSPEHFAKQGSAYKRLLEEGKKPSKATGVGVLCPEHAVLHGEAIAVLRKVRTALGTSNRKTDRYKKLTDLLFHPWRELRVMEMILAKTPESIVKGTSPIDVTTEALTEDIGANL